MNVLVTGSKGYIGQSIINSKNKRINYFEGSRQTIDLLKKIKLILLFTAPSKAEVD
jgi:dTDP-4-dehydrorhamnose reductase